MNAGYNPTRLRRRFAALPLLCAALIVSSVAVAGDLAATSAGVRPQDRVWLASTRHLCGSGGAPALWQWNASQWHTSDHQAFLDETAGFPQTVIYIHGNRVDDNEGASGGLAVYQQVVAAHAGEEPVRFVIWSWPATRICGPIKDVRTKAWRSDDEAVMLAHFLDPIQKREHRVGFVAFSYGARITGGALHLLGGGRLDGHVIGLRERPQFRAAFWAPAAHNNWLLPNGRHEHAMPLVDKWFSTLNRCDESLWRYERLEKCGNPPALGFVGFTGRGLLPADLQARWEEWEVSRIVGDTHNYHPYVFSPWIAEQTAKCVLWK